MKYFYVFIGGALGTLFRYIFSYLPHWHHFPIGTFMSNLLGAFLMGFLTSKLQHMLLFNAHVKKGLTTGMLGALTTFSTFQFELLGLMESHTFNILFFYFLCSSIFGLLSCYIGFRLGEN
ncbi:fluoride efflux transporter CrcB [Staphylococcus felis]|uniref:fluoride efflux transporter CrcB n=1 Tax=Staphylococcus felis TaxID=46127 RepID=UPI003967BE23